MEVVISESRERLFGSDGAVNFSALGPALDRALAESIVHRRWFGGKAQTIRDVATVECLPLAADVCLLLARVSYVQGAPEIYAVPMGLARGSAAERILADAKLPLIARLKITPDGEVAVLYDAMADTAVAALWLDLIAQGKQFAGAHGRLIGQRLDRFDAIAGRASTALEPKILSAEQSNSSISFGDRVILKLFRRLEAGVNPDVEVTSYLTGPLGFTNVPPVAGTIEYRRPGEAAISLAVLQGFVANQGDAWRHTLARLDGFFEQVKAIPAGTLPDAATLPAELPLVLAERKTPSVAAELIGPFLAEAELLGRRTAELHLALAAQTEDTDFRPEPFTPDYQRLFYETNTRLIRETFSLLAGKIDGLEPAARASAERLLKTEAGLQARFRTWLDQPVSGQRTRIHGDYHLGQVLWTGDDFMIIDFEGEPARAMTERRLKQSPLRDLAGMLRSLHYAVHASLLGQSAEGADRKVLATWSRVWHIWSSAALLRAYLAHTAGASFLPRGREELTWLLGELLLEKAVYELRYELNNRPDWLPIPLEAVLTLASTGRSEA
jgi:maltose alpha-D-glucosyltransferase / alpha-amylase